jgi:MarC family membrane protein
VIDIFLLLLIGIGPKIALVPFVELTTMDGPTKKRVVRKMLTTAAVVALILVVFGEFLTRLLHFSTGSLSVAGGIILLIIAVAMVLGHADPNEGKAPSGAKDPSRMAVFPLAVPYLLNPAGIVALVTLSAEAESLALLATIVLILAIVILIDILVFRWADRVSAHLDESRMLVTEKVFGFLLAALAVQLVLNGLEEVGVIQLTAHSQKGRPCTRQVASHSHPELAGTRASFDPQRARPRKGDAGEPCYETNAVLR